MDGVFTFWEKLVGLLTSQRVMLAAATFIASGLLIVNGIMPLLSPDFEAIDVPDAVALEAQLTAATSQVIVAIGAILSVLAALWKLIGSIENRPPVLHGDWHAIDKD